MLYIINMFPDENYEIHIVKSITKIVKQGNIATLHLIIRTSFEQLTMLVGSLSRVLRSVDIRLRGV